jgi:AcrR family transcriptional regulator
MYVALADNYVNSAANTRRRPASRRRVEPQVAVPFLYRRLVFHNHPMPRKTTSKVPPSRKRRTGEEARTAILDAAEQRLVASGPAGIRLQEVAADVGVSHPTVLHHFGSREALVEAVVVRAIDSLHAGIVAAVSTTAPEQPDKVAALLENVYDTLVAGGHARALFWLALSGYAPSVEELRIKSVAEVVHANRRSRRTSKKRMPPFEDTYFTLLLPALALLALSIIGEQRPEGASEDDVYGPKRFRAWLARLIHAHL